MCKDGLRMEVLHWSIRKGPEARGIISRALNKSQDLGLRPHRALSAGDAREISVRSFGAEGGGVVVRGCEGKSARRVGLPG